MEITLLVKSILGFLAILAILIFFYLMQSKKKAQKIVAKKAKQSSKSADNIDLESLVRILKRKASSAKELEDALSLVLKNYGLVHKKLGLRPHPDFDIYMDIVFTICRHPNVNKNIILKFDKELARLNPEYKKEINESLTKGLNSRGM